MTPPAQENERAKVTGMRTLHVKFEMGNEGIIEVKNRKITFLGELYEILENIRFVIRIDKLALVF